MVEPWSDCFGAARFSGPGRSAESYHSRRGTFLGRMTGGRGAVGAEYLGHDGACPSRFEVASTVLSRGVTFGMSLPANFVSLHPYFKVHPGKLEAFKAGLSAFVEKTAGE